MFLESITSTAPNLVLALYSLLGLGVVALMAVGARYLSGRASESKVWRVLSRAYMVVQAVVSHAEVALRPTMARVLADGKLTPEEAKELKAEVLRLVKEALGDQLDELVRTLKLSGSTVDVFLSGLIEQAHATLRPTAATALLSATSPRPPVVAPFAPPRVSPVGPSMPPAKP
jgi:hypothetical protein